MVLTVTTVILIMVMDLQNTFKIISYLQIFVMEES